MSKSSAEPIASCSFPPQYSECPRPRRQKSSSFHGRVTCFNLAAWEIQHLYWFIHFLYLLYILVSLGDTGFSHKHCNFPAGTVWGFWWLLCSTWKFSGSLNPNTRMFCLLFRSQDQLSRRRFPTGPDPGMLQLPRTNSIEQSSIQDII